MFFHRWLIKRDTTLNKRSFFRKMFIVWVILALINIAFYVSSEGFLIKVAKNLIVEDAKDLKAEAIVVYGGGEGPERLKQAVHLYNKGAAPYIILSGGSASGKNVDKTPWAERMKEIALRVGVPSRAIILDNEAGSTYENAINVIGILQKEKLSSVILVTSPYHMKRSLWVSNEVEKDMDYDVEWKPSSSTIDTFKLDAWWKNEKMKQLVIDEYIKSAGYHVLYKSW
ncbi:YdcF family protein [Bacillus tianshenii]|nr:YdcF family protein [Bacillus tianshenii]